MALQDSLEDDIYDFNTAGSTEESMMMIANKELTDAPNLVSIVTEVYHI